MELALSKTGNPLETKTGSHPSACSFRGVQAISTSNSQLGDRLVTYSDALIESHDADGEMLGEEGLLRILRLLGDVPAQTLTETLLAEISSRYPENLSDTTT